MRRRKQYGALPFRHTSAGALELLLISSRETGRWVIPKGWPKKGRSGARTAAEEAYEEAGVEGPISEMPIGRYRYVKWMPDRLVLCAVTVFAMRVTTELDRWPEEKERICIWASREEAAAMVDEPELAHIMRTAELSVEGPPL